MDLEEGVLVSGVASVLDGSLRVDEESFSGIEVIFEFQSSIASRLLLGIVENT